MTDPLGSAARTESFLRKQALENRGHRGGIIEQHRSIWRQRLPMQRVLKSALLALGLMVVLMGSRNGVARIWSSQIVWWLEQTGVKAGVAYRAADYAMMYRIDGPLINLSLTVPGVDVLWMNALGVLIVWWAAGRLPDAARPATYLLRFCALIHGASVFFFWLWPASFPHSVTEHVDNGLQQAWALMLLTPWLHLLIYYMFEVTWAQRIGLTLMTWLYIFLLAPLLYALHLVILDAGGLLAMPLLHLMFGAMIAVIGFVGLYGWAMSWANQGSRHPTPV